MNISEEVSYDKDGQVAEKSIFEKLFLALVIVLVAGLSFGLGKLSVVNNREGVKIEYDPSPSNSTSQSNQASVIKALENTARSPSTAENSASVVVSKNGTKYHYPNCPGAKQIKEENKIIFENREAAEASGYTLASNCSPK